MTGEAGGRPGAALFGRRGLVLTAVGVIAIVGALYFVLPAVAGLDETWRRISSGDPVWLLVALCFELLSFAAYMALFRGVFAPSSTELGWPESYRITMAGVAATRLFAVAGAGGIALTAWALRRAGLPARETTARLAAFYILLYGVFMASLLVGGLGLYIGLFAGPAPPGLTIVPAVFGAGVIVVVLAIAAVSRDLDGVLDDRGRGSRPSGRLRTFAAAVPATVTSGVTTGLALLRSPRPALFGGVGWWAFDIAVLWACLQAFGSAPPIAVVVTAYFVGMLANVLPVPGGIGTVDGGMIGALVGFGVAGGLAIVAVLSYRAFAFWLPTIPGVIAYAQLLRAPRRDSAA